MWSQRPHSGTSDCPLASIQRHISFALGGEAGSRLAVRLAMPLSGNTLLRLHRVAYSHVSPTIVQWGLGNRAA